MFLSKVSPDELVEGRNVWALPAIGEVSLLWIRE